MADRLNFLMEEGSKLSGNDGNPITDTCCETSTAETSAENNCLRSHWFDVVRFVMTFLLKRSLSLESIIPNLEASDAICSLSFVRCNQIIRSPIRPCSRHI